MGQVLTDALVLELRSLIRHGTREPQVANIRGYMEMESDD